jgi:hypothetical protein
MTYRTAVTFKKDGANVIELMAALDEFKMSERFFKHENEEEYEIASTWWEIIDAYTSDDSSYYEVRMYYHNEAAFMDWWQTYGEMHEEVFAITLEALAENGVEVKRYFENPGLVPAAGALPFSDFVSSKP